MPAVPETPFFPPSLLPFLKKLTLELNRLDTSRSFDVTQKDDASAVTSADLWASEQWCSFLAAHYPEDSIVSEEGFHKPGTPGGRTWFVDPIDGTRQFIDQSSDFYSLAGVIEQGRPLFGIHLNPKRGAVLAGGPEFGVFSIHIETGKIIAVERQRHTNTYFHLKGIAPEDRNAFYRMHGYSKPPFPSRQVHMLCPLMDHYAGFASFRPTWNWDLVAPAAIASGAGYEVSVVSMTGTPFFELETQRCASLICLPPETPASVKNDLKAFALKEVRA
jgi:3'-phosphoadenosine 5'-phosphosulfate (PAPS) 3'-phosphatase